MSEAEVYGIVAEFAEAESAVAAARRLRLDGFKQVEAYLPFPLEELDRALHPPRRPWIPLLVFLGGVVGACYSYFLQYWAAVLDFPLNIGGRPLNSWPAFTVSSFEVTVLFAVVAAFGAFLLFCRLPLLYHPVFNAPDFDRASQDHFFLCVEAGDPHFDAERLGRLFGGYDPVRVSLVPA